MPPLKIALVGGSGRVGRHIALEAERRGHLLRGRPQLGFHRVVVAFALPAHAPGQRGDQQRVRDQGEHHGARRAALRRRRELGAIEGK
ncbi:hypothetical protein [Variovorax paradoxus]|uniref:hypothetical protein n=1 Tax=Variovorax paradoxus TaxID=34073 RepID=UPI001ABCE157